MGSQMHMLLNMFTHKSRAFYQFSKIVELKKIDEKIMLTHLAHYYQKTKIFADSEVLSQIIFHANNIPHYVQYLASAAWEEAKGK